MERAAWCAAGVLIVVVGVHMLLRPELYQQDFDPEPSRDPSAPPRLVSIRKVRLTGLFLVAIGVMWIYMVLFVKPTNDPVLI